MSGAPGTGPSGCGALKSLGGKKHGIQRVHVVGAGVMGGDIAAWCALRGFQVTLQDRELKFIETALARAAILFERKIKRPELIILLSGLTLSSGTLRGIIAPRPLERSVIRHTQSGQPSL